MLLVLERNMVRTLAPSLERRGCKLLLYDQVLSKYKKTLQKTLIITTALIITVLLYPLMEHRSMELGSIKFENGIIYYFIIVFTISFLTSSVIIWTKIKRIKNKVSSVELAFLFSYKAYMALEAYADTSQFKSKLKNLEDAIKNINRLSYTVSIGWKTFIKYNDILPNIDINMNVFVNTLSGLKIALKKRTHEPIVIQVALIVLMEFLISDKKNNLEKINKELAKYNFMNQTTSIKQRIKEFMMDGKNLKHIIIISFLLVITISPTILIILIDPSFIAIGMVISTIFTVILGSYVTPLLKKITVNE